MATIALIVICAWVLAPVAMLTLIGWCAADRPLSPEEAQEQRDFIDRYQEGRL